MEQYYKIDEVAESFSVKPRTVYRWIEQKKIKVTKLNKSPRISESEIERFIKEYNPQEESE